MEEDEKERSDKKKLLEIWMEKSDTPGFDHQQWDASSVVQNRQNQLLEKNLPSNLEGI